MSTDLNDSNESYMLQDFKSKKKKCMLYFQFSKDLIISQRRTKTDLPSLCWIKLNSINIDQRQYNWIKRRQHISGCSHFQGTNNSWVFEFVHHQHIILYYYFSVIYYINILLTYITLTFYVEPLSLHLLVWAAICWTDVTNT